MHHTFTGYKAYFIGDPCAVICNEPNFSAIQLVLQDLAVYQDALFKIDDMQVWVVRLPAGETAFQDQNGAGYSTESEMLAILPLELVDDPGGEEVGTVVLGPSLNMSYMPGNLIVGDINISFT